MILTVGGIKGGSGKTTLAINIAVARSLKKERVLLVDADDQKSTLLWSEQRSSLKLTSKITVIQLSGSSILPQINEMSSDYDQVVIDVGGRDTASQRASLLVCDIFLTPFRPRSLDVWTLDKLSLLLEEARSIRPSLKAFSVLNQADPRGSDNKDTKKILQEIPGLETLSCSICQRKVFSNSITEGLGVLEFEPEDVKAKKELKKLVSILYH
jgi:chromosome partitioning protein